MFPKEAILEHGMFAQIEKVLVGKTLTEEQKESMEKVFASPIIAKENLQDVLDLFSTLEEKQLIIKFFLPSVTLADLQEAGVLSPNQVRETIRKTIIESKLDQEFPLDSADMEKAIDTVRPEDIMITTALFPAPVVDAILNGVGKKEIRRAVNEVNGDNRDDSRAQNDL